MIVKAVFEILKKHGLTISFAESMTGGYLSYVLVKEKGASNHLKGSLVTYTDKMKETILQVKPEDISKYNVISSQIVSQMANNLSQITKTDICISVSGNIDYEYNVDGQLSFYYAILIGNNLEVFKGVLANKKRTKNIHEATMIIYQKLHESLSRIYL